MSKSPTVPPSKRRHPTRKPALKKLELVPVEEKFMKPEEAVLNAPLTLASFLKSWQVIVTLIVGVSAIATLIVALLSYKFASVESVEKIDRDQAQLSNKLDSQVMILKMEDNNTVSSVGSVRSDVQEVKVEVKEIRKEQQQTNENIIRLMERFSVKPVDAK